MRIKSFFVTLLGVALAGGSVMIAKDFLTQQQGAAEASVQPQVVNVVVARRDIDFGQPVSAQSLRLQPWPRDAVPSGAFTDLDQLISANESDSRRVLTKVYEGEIVLESKVSKPGGRVTIVQKITEGMRAMSISVNAVTAVGGFVTPGDRVDIVLTQSVNGSLKAGTFLQNIRVIGVDQQSEENSDQPVVARTVTVEVSPEDGQKLALAQRAGTLSLSLRTLDAVDQEALELVDLNDLFGTREPIDETKKRGATIKVRRGVEEEEVDLQ